LTTISTLIRDAFRESNLIAISADPTEAEQAEGLRLLNRVVLSLLGNEAGDPLNTFPLGSNNVSRPSGFPDQPQNDWFVPVNVRLVLNLTDDQTVYLHPQPNDGARFAVVDKSDNLSTNSLTVMGNGYTIEDEPSLVFNTNGTAREYFFRADTGNWTAVSPLTAESESPFPEQFDDLLIISLAMRLNPRHGVAADAQSVETLRSLLRKFKAQYGQTVETPLEEGLLRTLGVRYFKGAYSDTNAFTSGRPR